MTDFDRIRVLGPFEVTLETGKAPSARAEGTPTALERVTVEVQGRQLTIRPNRSAWGGWPGASQPPVKLRITVPMLRGAAVDGSGTLSVTQMKGLRLSLNVQGSGTLSVANIAADRLDVGMLGAGTTRIAGTAKQLFVTGRGSGTFAASDLAALDVQLSWESAGNADAKASRTAKIISTGAGRVTVAGKAACTVNALGSGEVTCGNGP